ncbi:MAG: ABC transporter ATP-binding protein/permease [Oscillospiraceae bacterium]|jgi:ATP-binding cassette subfamily B protein|nr:ABC transporter ATP-binding protein/permease [Oscillospiraceae bacterium]
MKKIFRGLRLLWRGIRVIFKAAPAAMLTVLNQPVRAVTPFVTIYFSAIIFEQLAEKAAFALILPNILWAVGLDAALYFITNSFAVATEQAWRRLYIEEHQSVAKALISPDYETLEDTQTQKKVAELQNHWQQKGSPLIAPLFDLSNLFGGIFTCVVAVIFLRPLFGIIFKRTGDGFLNSPWLGISVCAFIAAGVGFVLFMSIRMNKQWFTLHRKYIKIEGIFSYYAKMLEDHKSGKEVRVYAQQDFIERHATEKLLTEGVELQRKLGSSQAMQSALLAIIGAILGFGVYLLIGVKGLFGFIGAGAIVRCMGSFLQVVNGLMQIGSNVGRLNAFIPGLRYFFDVLDLIPKHISGKLIADPGGAIDIEFRDVSFIYPGQENYALRHVNFRLRGGEHLAIVGENGSGKTTFIKLLCRLYDPTEGEILLNGVNIREYSEDEYRRLFSVVFQDYQLFALPLGQNIASCEQRPPENVHDDDNAFDEEKILLCLEESGFNPRLAKMPQGLDTWLYRACDKDGVEISGGEAQKLALARALYKDAPVIVLDEPTAALDPLAEAAVYAGFNRFAEGKAAIYISHRLSSCRFCEKVAVFEAGELVQYGGHGDLIADEDGKYYELWNAQAKYYVN